MEEELKDLLKWISDRRSIEDISILLSSDGDYCTDVEIDNSSVGSFFILKATFIDDLLMFLKSMGIQARQIAEDK